MKPIPSRSDVSGTNPAIRNKRRIEMNSHEEGVLEVRVPDAATLLDLFKTGDERLAVALLSQAGSAAELTQPDQQTFIIDMIADFAPRDATERLLTMQMATTHAGMMHVASKMNNATHHEASEAYDRSFNRLARTFTTQMEALRKHRNGGQSRVTVEHVTVNEGGQVIVGNVEGRSGLRKS